MTDLNIEDDEGVVIHEHFNATKEEMWETITDPDELSTWLGGRCTIEPRVGGAVRFDLPDDGIAATGVVRGWDPPDPSRSLAGFSHTFIDQAEPDALFTCSWKLIPTSDGGCNLRFSLQAAEDSVEAKLTGPWARLGVAVAVDVPERQTTPIDRAVELLREASDIVLISWVSEDIPRVLVETGFSVVSKNGPEPDNWGRAILRDGEIDFARVDPPTHADLLHLDWTIGFHDYLELATSIGVRTFWYHSAATRPPAPTDRRGCWLPARKSARLRAAVEAASMNYIDDHYIVDVAGRL